MALVDILKRLAQDNVFDKMPLIYFCGKGMTYLDLGSQFSPASSHWLYLQPLGPPHVKRLVLESTMRFPLPLSSPSPAFPNLIKVSPDELNILIEAIIKWTAGGASVLVLCPLPS